MAGAGLSARHSALLSLFGPVIMLQGINALTLGDNCQTPAGKVMCRCP